MPAPLPAPYVEHLNLTVSDLEETTDFLLHALPGWRIRGEGRMEGFGQPVRWRHVGTDDSYLALQDGGDGAHPDWRTPSAGMKHVGLVVASLEDTLRRLAAAGYEVDHRGPPHPHRRNAYVFTREGVQFEFVEYLSDVAGERNDYAR